MRVASVVGTRPQFIKAAPVSKVLRRRHKEILIHTGQHYDPAMSEAFFQSLHIPRPAINLAIGSGPHGVQTGKMLAGLERALTRTKPDVVLVYGDTNSTLAGALASAKLHLPVAHVEAGLRSFNRSMPEEINRIVADHLSALLFAPTNTAVANLTREGITQGVENVGDVMYDVALATEAEARRRTIRATLGLRPREYLLATIHRAATTDERKELGKVAAALSRASETILFPVHPRTRKMLRRFRLDRKLGPHVRLLPPLDYLDFRSLLADARLVLTDSGGVQKEAYWSGVPCVTLRTETEWVETVDDGWNTLTGTDVDRILAAIRGARTPSQPGRAFGDGHAADRIIRVLEAFIGPRRGRSPTRARKPGARTTQK